MSCDEGCHDIHKAEALFARLTTLYVVLCFFDVLVACEPQPLHACSSIKNIFGMCFL
jgi:hypothetical protein